MSRRRLFKREPISNVLRFKILTRDRCRCQFCGCFATENAELQVDHLWPVALGGTNDEWNLATACVPCNQAKKAKPIEWWKARFDRFRDFYFICGPFTDDIGIAQKSIFNRYYEPLSVWMSGEAMAAEYIAKHDAAQCNLQSSISAIEIADPEEPLPCW